VVWAFNGGAMGWAVQSQDFDAGGGSAGGCE
jgi:hypothetical protein